MTGAWRRMVGVAAAVVLAGAGLAACGGGSSGDGGGATRQVLVDYSSDEFASFALYNFPDKITVRQGDTVEFKQTWTGEPHTVTGGTLVNGLLEDGKVWIDFFEAFEALAGSGADLPNPDDPGDATAGDFAKGVAGAEDTDLRDRFTETYEALIDHGIALPPLDPTSTQPFSELVDIVETKSDEYFADLPSAFTDGDELAQNVAQPCYKDEGGPPASTDEACSDAQQKQPEFTGRQSYYNSGVIPYEGERSNTFAVEIADDAAVGTYLFYCAIHGLGQQSAVEVVKAGASIPDQSEVNKQIRTKVKVVTGDLRDTYRAAKESGKIIPPGQDVTLEGPFAGLPGEEHTAINEFVPRNRTVKAGEPITWKMMGSDHSISFNVPKYFPIMEFLDDGTVRINPKINPAAGGAIPYEPSDTDDVGPDESEIVKHDGGTYDGKGFWSSGLIGSEPYLEYTMKITKPGTYSYACLLHPAMVGTIKVT